jgi:hypothetical protein
MTLTIPADGIDEIRRTWTGRGGLWAAIAAVEGETGVIWTPELARRRAARVVVEMLRPCVQAWPDSSRKWIDALPAQSIRRHVVADAPGAGIDWPTTRIRGWPPREFDHRRRTRVADTLLVTTTRWTIETLTSVLAAADRVDPEIVDSTTRARHQVALSMLQLEPLRSALPTLPSRADLAALRASGRPWGAVAAAATWLRILDHDPAQFADLPIDPDPALADRLFHVAVMGLVLRALRVARWTIRPTGLPGSPDGTPVFAATDPAGATWDVWYEMAAAWAHYGVPAPYPPAVRGVTGTGGPLGCDIALVRISDRAVVIECKYSADPSYVGRNGYEQTLAYMTEALTGLVESVSGIVVGVRELIAATGETYTFVGNVRVASTDELAAALEKAIEDATRALVG